MKKIMLVLAFIASTLFVNAQETTFKPFRVGIDFGYAIPGGEGSKGGIIFALEPKYAINDAISVGLRMEGAIMARATTDENGMTNVGEVKASGSYLLTGDYYFNTNDFRPFAGVGVGIYSVAGANLDSNGEGDIQSGNKFGGAPRVGFEYGHFRAAVEYNLVGKTGSISNNYIGIKLGFFVGGGRND